MIPQKTINRIRRCYYEKHLPVHEIASRVKISPCTVYKYLKPEFEQPVEKANAAKLSKLDRYYQVVHEWLLEDTKHYYKQRHTANRVHNRLCEMFPDDYIYSYQATRLMYNKIKYKIAKQLPKSEEDELGFFIPGEAEVGCGSITVNLKGKSTDAFVLALCFPYSKAVYLQIILDKNHECILQCLQGLYNYLGGVPSVQKFSPNTKLYDFYLGEVKSLADELYAKFLLFYDFKAFYFLPENEGTKTVVGRLLQYYRRRIFKKTPVIKDLDSYNKTLLSICKDSFNRHPIKNPHHTVKELHQHDLENLLPLPKEKFIIRSCYRRRVTKTAQVKIDNKHKYALPPKYANKFVYVYVYADKVEILSIDMNPIVSYPRSFDKQDKLSIDWSLYLDSLVRNPSALRNSEILKALPRKLSKFLHSTDNAHRQIYASALKRLTDIVGFDGAAQFLHSVCEEEIKSLQDILDIYERSNKNL